LFVFEFFLANAIQKVRKNGSPKKEMKEKTTPKTGSRDASSWAKVSIIIIMDNALLLPHSTKQNIGQCILAWLSKASISIPSPNRSQVYV